MLKTRATNAGAPRIARPRRIAALALVGLAAVGILGGHRSPEDPIVQAGRDVVGVLVPPPVTQT